MIKYVTGGLLATDSEALVNSVNCVGVMGRSVALVFKRRVPDNFKADKAACDWGELQEAGEPLRLRYVKASHGPYAENLRHVLRTLDGCYIEGGGAGGDDGCSRGADRQ